MSYLGEVPKAEGVYFNFSNIASASSYATLSLVDL